MVGRTVNDCTNCGETCDIARTECPKCGGDRFGPPRVAAEPVAAPEIPAFGRLAFAAPGGLPRTVAASAAPAQEGSVPPLRLYHVRSHTRLSIVGDAVIGREGDARADFFGHFQHISRRHCQLAFQTDTGWTVADMDSVNGTVVDGRRLQPHQPVPLRDGVHLILADQAFTIHLREEGSR